LVVKLFIIALLAAAATATTKWRASVREAEAEVDFPPEGQFVTVEGQRMHAVVRGKGPDLVLIHGSSGSVRDFTSALMPALIDRYRVIAVDRPGMGYSDDYPGSEDIVVQARLIQEAATELGAERPIVLGQSYGGAVAMAWAVHYPDTLSALVAVAAATHPWTTPLPRYYRILSSTLGQWIAAPLLTAFVPKPTIRAEVDAVFTPQTAPQGYYEHFGPSLSLRRETLRINARQRAALKSQIVKMFPKYKTLTLPVEIIHGTADTTVYAKIHAERLAADVPGANLVLLEGVGHMPHHVAIPDVVAAVDRAAARAGLREDGK